MKPVDEELTPTATLCSALCVRGAESVAAGGKPVIFMTDALSGERRIEQLGVAALHHGVILAIYKEHGHAVGRHMFFQ